MNGLDRTSHTFQMELLKEGILLCMIRLNKLVLARIVDSLKIVETSLIS